MPIEIEIYGHATCKYLPLSYATNRKMTETDADAIVARISKAVVPDEKLRNSTT